MMSGTHYSPELAFEGRRSQMAAAWRTIFRTRDYRDMTGNDCNLFRQRDTKGCPCPLLGSFCLCCCSNLPFDPLHCAFRLMKITLQMQGTSIFLKSLRKFASGFQSLSVAKMSQSKL